MIEGGEAVQLLVSEQTVLKIGSGEGIVNKAAKVGRRSNTDEREDLLAVPIQLGVHLVSLAHIFRMSTRELLAHVAVGTMCLS